jgi:hypothetical protein
MVGRSEERREVIAAGRVSLRVSVVLCCALAQLAGATPSPGATPTPASRALVNRMGATGRAEASLIQRVPDPLGGPGAERRGRLALERPDRVRLDYEGGESVTLRRDGGEWLQPRLTQMLVFDSTGAGAAQSAWDLLLGRDDAIAAHAVGAGRWRLRPMHPDPDLPDSVEIVLDPNGLPKRLVSWVAGERSLEFEISGWRFPHAKGRPDFVLKAPPGYEVIRSGP